MRDPCAALDTCHHWTRHDDRCDRATEPHSTMCSTHADQEDMPWWESHAAEDCCDTCCKGEIEHE